MPILMSLLTVALNAAFSALRAPSTGPGNCVCIFGPLSSYYVGSLLLSNGLYVYRLPFDSDPCHGSPALSLPIRLVRPSPFLGTVPTPWPTSPSQTESGFESVCRTSLFLNTERTSPLFAYSAISFQPHAWESNIDVGVYPLCDRLEPTVPQPEGRLVRIHSTLWAHSAELVRDDVLAVFFYCFVRWRDRASIRLRELGVVFKDLRVVGLGAATGYQPIFGSFFNAKVIVENIQARASRRHPALRDSEGIVRPGEMLQFVAKHYCGDIVYSPEDDIHFPKFRVDVVLRFAAKSFRAAHNIAQTKNGLRHVKIRPLAMRLSGSTVSGGEKKRVSIGEALTFFDIISYHSSTRGLDASTALEFVLTLRIATDVRTYQPSYFDRAEQARQYFIDLGFGPSHRQTVSLLQVYEPLARTVREDFKGPVPQTAAEFASTFLASEVSAANRMDIEAYFKEFVGHLSVPSRTNRAQERSTRPCSHHLVEGVVHQYDPSEHEHEEWTKGCWRNVVRRHSTAPASDGSEKFTPSSGGKAAHPMEWTTVTDPTPLRAVPKVVQLVSRQLPSDSRRLWESATSKLLSKEIGEATRAK
ncbi:hypothetical protein EDB84DRAFT_1580527 [Lactarius hengduanensis]|nr:hypothetical protein EDB84DRAFT_1580527 [Lactarius hengduanensis]